MNRSGSIQKVFLSAGAIGWRIAVLGVLLPMASPLDGKSCNEDVIEYVYCCWC